MAAWEAGSDSLCILWTMKASSQTAPGLRTPLCHHEERAGPPAFGGQTSTRGCGKDVSPRVLGDSSLSPRSTPCPSVKHGDEWGEPSRCESGDSCQYCHSRTEQQFHPEVRAGGGFSPGSVSLTALLAVLGGPQDQPRVG